MGNAGNKRLRALYKEMVRGNHEIHISCMYCNGGQSNWKREEAEKYSKWAKEASETTLKIKVIV